MGERFDVVVVGAGHNSLTAAAYLARAGLRCLVLEARDDVGGDTRTEELTLPGFKHDSCSTAHTLIQTSPLFRDDELGLLAGGLTYIRPDPVVHAPFPDGESITQWRDPQRTEAEFARFSRADGRAFRRAMSSYAEIAPLVGAYRYTPIGLGPSLEERLAAHPQAARWLRRSAMSAWEVIRTEFESPHVRAFLLWMAYMTMQPPDRPGTGLLAYSLLYGRQRQSWAFPAGGSGALPAALRTVIEAHDGAIRTGQAVDRLIVDHGRCVGVRTTDGTRYDADRAVLSSVHIKDLIGMAPSQEFGADFEDGVNTWQAGLCMFVAHYATTVAPTFSAPRLPTTPVAAAIPQSVERILRIAGDAAAGRVATDDPVLLVLCPTVADPSRAPEGKHTLKVIGIHTYELTDGPQTWDTSRGDVATANLRELQRYAPNLGDDTILGSALYSPLDLERANAHNWHGSCHGGDMSPAQSGALRPVPGFATHRMPITGLYQTGATTHPGGSVSSAPGRNAAIVLLSDLGIAGPALPGSMDAAPAART